MLAVTRMENQICVAGVNEANVWRRPVRLPTYNLSKDDIFQDGVCVIKNYNVVKYKSIRSLQNTPQSEDFLVDWSDTPTVISTVNEQSRLHIFNKIDESKNIDEINDGIRRFLIENNRSLIMVKPDKVISSSFGPAKGKGFQTRLKFELNNIQYNPSCTDLRWRAYMNIKQNRNNIEQLFKGKEIYLAIGLTRELYLGRIWPMVIGVHMIPDLENIEIDYDNL
jgi:hypothetical protein